MSQRRPPHATSSRGIAAVFREEEQRREAAEGRELRRQREVRRQAALTVLVRERHITRAEAAQILDEQRAIRTLGAVWREQRGRP